MFKPAYLTSTLRLGVQGTANQKNQTINLEWAA